MLIWNEKVTKISFWIYIDLSHEIKIPPHVDKALPALATFFQQINKSLSDIVENLLNNPPSGRHCTRSPLISWKYRPRSSALRDAVKWIYLKTIHLDMRPRIEYFVVWEHRPRSRNTAGASCRSGFIPPVYLACSAPVACPPNITRATVDLPTLTGRDCVIFKTIFTFSRDLSHGVSRRGAGEVALNWVVLRWQIER